ncbi:MAG: hypothetical protein DRI57_01985 [Deltaproteobacteria bacterium]|nr:MAG: hypothetical protein DRI57_01985 [Deltaproteobacteria bacterium]
MIRASDHGISHSGFFFSRTQRFLFLSRDRGLDSPAFVKGRLKCSEHSHISLSILTRQFKLI